MALWGTGFVSRFALSSRGTMSSFASAEISSAVALASSTMRGLSPELFTVDARKDFASLLPGKREEADGANQKSE